MQVLTVEASTGCSDSFANSFASDASPWCSLLASLALPSASVCTGFTDESSHFSFCTASSEMLICGTLFADVSGDPGGPEETSGHEQLRSAEMSDRSADWTDALSVVVQSVLLSPMWELEVCRWPLGTASAWAKTSPASVSSSSWLEESDGVEALDLCGVRDSWLVRVVCSMLEAVSLWWAKAGLEESSEDSEELDQTVPFSISPCRFSRDYNPNEKQQHVTVVSADVLLVSVCSRNVKHVNDRSESFVSSVFQTVEAKNGAAVS